MPNDIEYPQPQAIVGPTFHAGGEYDLRKIAGALVGGKVRAGTKIIGKLFRQQDGMEFSPTSDPFSVTDTYGFWDVTFTNCPTDKNPCIIRAYVTTDTTSTELDNVPNITIALTATGEVQVTLIM